MKLHEVFKDWHKDDKVLTLIRSRVIKQVHLNYFDYYNFYVQDLSKTNDKGQSISNTSEEYIKHVNTIRRAIKLFGS